MVMLNRDVRRPPRTSRQAPPRPGDAHSTSRGFTAGWRIFTPKVVFAAALLYLAVAYALVYAIDVHDALGLRSRMVDMGMNGPAVWYQVFGSRKITSIVQWAYLAAATPLAGVIGGRLIASGRRGAGAFWSLVSVALALTLMGDGGNHHDILVAYGSDLFPQYASIINMVVRLGLFGGIAVVLVYAMVAYGRSAWTVIASRPYIVIAFVAAALGALSDVSAWTGFYDAAGLFVHNTVAQGQLVVLETHTLTTQAGMFMDSVWEESLELVSYSAFLAAALAYGNAVWRERPEAVMPDEQPVAGGSGTESSSA